MKRALIHVDYSNDFVADDGVLTAGQPAQEILPNVMRLTKEFYEQGEDIFITMDTHIAGDPYHPETKLYPPHNIAGTWGHELYGEMQIYYDEIKDSDHVHYIQKTRYSAFAGTDLDIRLRERKVDTVVILGVATDICVLHTAMDAYNLGYQIVVYEDTVASFNPDGHTFALNHIKSSLGGDVI
ncbi:isochorismatase [Suicoccus acidiformans]|uniref:Isochorismatase n=1 Tax=Suicoccus acidiformans TaxID=2036206 RepID=A0A347WI07_9LACT|nr:isochorismatase family cysteine hydrolase [Suicoccus acidiformans]AXY24714.1 isochorismatase [Suicoccus acidiformans]